jgi:hypothetical protein
MANPVAQARYRPVSLPMPAHEPEVHPANSLSRRKKLLADRCSRWRACAGFVAQGRLVGDGHLDGAHVADRARAVP